MLGELRLLSLFVFAASLVAATFWAYGDRFVLGMTGARELPVGEAPALHSTVERLAAVLRIAKPKVCILRDGHPRAYVVGRGPAARRSPSPRASSVALPPAELEGVLAHELAHVRTRDVLTQTTAVMLAATLIETSRIGGFLERTLLFVLGPLASAFVHALSHGTARVRRRPHRRRRLRLAARPRRRADPARAGDGARRLPGVAGDRAALHDRPVPRGRAGRAVRDASAGGGAGRAAPRSRSGVAREAPRRLNDERAASRRPFVRARLISERKSAATYSPGPEKAEYHRRRRA